MLMVITAFAVMAIAATLFAQTGRKLAKAKASHAEVDQIYQPVSAEEKRMKERGDQYADLRVKYADGMERLRANEALLAKYSIGVGTMDAAAYAPIGKGMQLEALEQKLAVAKERAKTLVKNKRACICSMGDNVVVNGRRAEAKKLFNREIKLRIRCLDNNFKAAAALADWNNIGRLMARARDAFDEINRSGHTVKTYLQPEYLEAKIEELRLDHESKQLAKVLKEEQRENRRIEREAEREEARIKAAVAKAEKERAEMERLVAEEMSRLATATEEQRRLLDLRKQELEVLRQRETRAKSLAQMTRAGYVYVVSNTASFGEGMCKIGMTRRADPNDRVKELGDASVPELFDVHTFVFTQDAPALEKYLHDQFTKERVNLVNNRKEFFSVEPQTVLDVIGRYSGEYEVILTN
jgi:hypothetical protein